MRRSGSRASSGGRRTRGAVATLACALLAAAAPLMAQTGGNAVDPVGVPAVPARPPDLEQRLDALPATERTLARQRLAQWDAWSGDERAMFIARLGAWDAMPPAERAARRAEWQAWRALRPDERERLRGVARGFEARPADEQAALRERFHALDATAQRGWQLGPVLGADYWNLHGLLAQVPPGEHERLLGTLHDMSAAQRAQLAVLVRRTPPQERDALRRELVSTAREQRQAWLDARLER